MDEEINLDVASFPKYNLRISNEEWFEISLALEPHHAVFYKIWQMGKPVFNEEIETAAVQFDDQGKFVWFHFNPQFWKRLQFKHKLFVISHEALHIILNHGIRTKDCNVNRMATNVALDVVVNHTLVNNFGFARRDIVDWQDYCWVDTIFKDKKPLPPENEMYEYYYNLFEKVYGDGGPGDGENGPKTVDDHDGLSSGNWGEVIKELSECFSEEEKQSLKSTVNKHFQKTETENQKAGTGTGGQWVFANVENVAPKKKWETVIKKWSRKYLTTTDKDTEQWVRLNRRMCMLPNDMFLPSDMEIEEYEDDKTRIQVWFFLDTSGSCWNLKDRFFNAAMSLPKKRFDIRLFCFDTKVEETTLESRKIYGGGGTSFKIIEEEIQKHVLQGENYPEAIWVITDGYGDRIKPQYPEKWSWFITNGGSKTYIDPKCNFFNLKDYD